jgi:lysophospholipase
MKTALKTIFLLSLMTSTLSWAVPEQEVEQDWDSKIYPFYKSMSEGQFKNPQGLTLRYSYLLDPQNEKTIVIVPGRSEPAMKYAEVIYDLKDSGVNIFIMDIQGQGASDRILEDSKKGHVVNFQDYVHDMEQFIDEVVTPKSAKPKYLLAHSMGAGVSVLYMNKNPHVFTKAALISPMLKINSKPYSEGIAQKLAKVLTLAMMGNCYAPDAYYIPYENIFEKNPYTHSHARFNVSHHISDKWPEQMVAGPTSNWVYQAITETKTTENMKVETPIFIFQAGVDQIVKPERQISFCQNNDCTLKQFPDAHHEILMEKDEMRDELMKDIKSIFEI